MRRDYLPKNAFDSTKHFVDSSYLYSVLFEGIGWTGGVDIYGLIEELKQRDIAEPFEYRLLNEMAGMVEMCFHGGGLDAWEFREALIEMKAERDQRGYTYCGRYGRFTAIVLSIGLASAEWWLEHPEEAGMKQKGEVEMRGLPLPAWAAGDLAGALYGAAWGALASAASGEFNGSAVGWGALGGAVNGSTGLDGRLARKFQKL